MVVVQTSDFPLRTQPLHAKRAGSQLHPEANRLMKSSADEHEELVQLVVDTSCGGASFRLTLLFAMEVLQPAVEPVARDTQSADDETPVHRHVVRGGVDLGLVPSSSTCELVSVELSLSQLRRLKAGELLPVETPIRNVRLLDADGSPFLAGRLVPARNNKLQIIAARDRDRAHGEVVR